MIGPNLTCHSSPSNSSPLTLVLEGISGVSLGVRFFVLFVVLLFSMPLLAQEQVQEKAQEKTQAQTIAYPDDNPFELTGEELESYRNSYNALQKIIVAQQVKPQLVGKMVQQQLHQVYVDHPKYIAQLDGSTYLSDALIGPVTESWLAYFSTEFNLDIKSDDDVFAQDLLESLVTVVQIIQRYPNWRQVIVSFEFKQWIKQNHPEFISCGSWPGCYQSAQNLHKLLDEFVDFQPQVEQEYVHWLGYYYSLTEQEYAALVESNKTLSEEQLAVIETVVDVNFAQLYLLDVGLKMAGLKDMNDAQWVELIAAMEKEGRPPRQPIKPVKQWSAVEDCGCAQTLVNKDNGPNYFYGFYPFWQDPTTTPINFEQFSRIGYFSATLDNENQLVLPSSWHEKAPGNWQNLWQHQQSYAEMVSMAHKYRVKVDLVVANHRADWQSFGHNPSGNYFFSTALIEQLVRAIKTPLPGQVVNKLKPMMSFDFSHERTKADGITLDLHLSGVKTSKQTRHVIDFISQLRGALSSDASITTDTIAQGDSRISAQSYGADTPKADISDDYYLNMMVPVTELLANEQKLRNNLKLEAALKKSQEGGQQVDGKKASVGFYTIENLQAIADSVNIFILVFDPLTVEKMRKDKVAIEYCPALQDSADEVSLMKCMLDLLSLNDNVDVAAKLYNKMIPLIKTDVPTEQFKQVLDYTKWSYKGAAFWNLPIAPDNAAVITSSYFPDLNVEVSNSLIAPIKEQALQTCDLLCPNRWILRSVLFALFLVVVGYMVLSIWIFSLQAFLGRWYFLVFLLLASAFLLALITCDPFWQDYQALFLFVFAMVFLVILFIKKIQADERMNYP